MAAPSGTIWGSTVGDYGRIGIYVSLETTNTTVTPTVEIWFWSKYSVSDGNNKLYYTFASSSSSATKDRGSVSINTTVDSGSGWSTSNQFRIYIIEHTEIARGTSAVTRYLYAKLTNIDRVGGTMYVNTTFSVPKLASYTVKYSANGGSGAPSSQTKWYGKALTLSTATPTRTGYSFQGWGTSASDTSVNYDPGDSYTANADETLYAIWKANTYTVKYDANGGSGAPSNQTKTYGKDLTLSSTIPKRTNYTFKGWATSKSGSVKYAAGAKYTTNAAATLYAVWELAYTKPRITNVSVARCDSSGNVRDDGTYALLNFKWATDKSVSGISVAWLPADGTGSETITASGTSGTVTNKVVGAGIFSTEKTYKITITVKDSGGSTPVSKTLNSQIFLMDALPENKGVAFGKAAEASKAGYADFKFTPFLREHAEYANDKSIKGIDTDGTAYSALIPVTASGNTSLGHGLYKAGKGNTHIYGNAVQFYTNNGVHLNGNDFYFDPSRAIKVARSDGKIIDAITPMNGNDNVVMGYDNYNDKKGNSHIYGYDLLFGVSNVAEPGTYRPYIRQGMSVTVGIKTAGYVSNAGSEVYFFVPLARPIVGSPTVTVSSNKGFILRQNGQYTHGSTAEDYCYPTDYSAYCQLDVGVFITAKFTNKANVVNNAPIGIHWSGILTFT